MVSVEDVADRAGVSAATVSRVLSDSSHPVSDDTRARVLDAADELDFRPNLVARGLVTSRTSTLGAIVHDIADPYFGEIVRGLEDRAWEAGYRVVVSSSDRDAGRELSYVETLLGHRVDGLVFAGGGIEDDSYQSELRGLLDGYRSRGGIVVNLAPSVYEDGLSALPDNRAAAAAMTDLLHERGHTRIGFVAGPKHIRTSAIRLAGHTEALDRNGLEVDERLIAAGDFTVDGGEQAARRLLERVGDLTAIFAANDLMACGVLRALAAAGVEVPGDVAVAGLDDIYLATSVRPTLTTVDLAMYEMGRTGADLVVRSLAGEDVGSIELPHQLVERESTTPSGRQGLPPAGDPGPTA